MCRACPSHGHIIHALHRAWHVYSRELFCPLICLRVAQCPVINIPAYDAAISCERGGGGTEWTTAPPPVLTLSAGSVGEIFQILQRAQVEGGQRAAVGIWRAELFSQRALPPGSGQPYSGVTLSMAKYPRCVSMAFPASCPPTALST
jgi:hypothetical protein